MNDPFDSMIGTGTLVQGKTSLTGRSEKNRIHKPETEWDVAEQAHEALVSEEVFKKAALLRTGRFTKRKREKHPLVGN